MRRSAVSNFVSLRDSGDAAKQRHEKREIRNRNKSGECIENLHTAKAIEMADESTLLSVAAGHDIKQLALKRNGGATGGLIREDEIGGDL